MSEIGEMLFEASGGRLRLDCRPNLQLSTDDCLGLGCDYGTGVPRRTRLAAPGWRHRNTTAASSYEAGVGPDQPRSQPEKADSDYDVACKGVDPLIHTPAHVS